MKSIIIEFIEILKKQYEIYLDFFGLAQEKTEILVKNDLKDLKKIVDLENILFKNFTKLESERKSLYTELLDLYQIKDIETKISNFCNFLSDENDKNELLNVCKLIKGINIKLSQINKQNQDLINLNLDFIRFNLELIKSSSSNIVYSAKGEQIINESIHIDFKN